MLWGSLTLLTITEGTKDFLFILIASVKIGHITNQARWILNYKSTLVYNHLSTKWWYHLTLCSHCKSPSHDWEKRKSMKQTIPYQCYENNLTLQISWKDPGGSYLTLSIFAKHWMSAIEKLWANLRTLDICLLSTTCIHASHLCGF